MKTVLDANIFVSALLWGGNPLAVTQRAARGFDKLFFTGNIINEVERVLEKPKLRIGKYDVKRMVTRIESIGENITVLPKHRVKGVCRDSKDDMYLECAVAATADYIISGDRDLLDLKEYGGVKIVSAREYLRLIQNLCKPNGLDCFVASLLAMTVIASEAKQSRKLRLQKKFTQNLQQSP